MILFLIRFGAPPLLTMNSLLNNDQRGVISESIPLFSRETSSLAGSLKIEDVHFPSLDYHSTTQKKPSKYRNAIVTNIDLKISGHTEHYSQPTNNSQRPSKQGLTNDQNKNNKQSANPTSSSSSSQTNSQFALQARSAPSKEKKESIIPAGIIAVLFARAPVLVRVSHFSLGF